MKHILTARILVVLFGISCLAWQAEAQTVSHPLSEISTTAKYYSYTHMLSTTQKKEIRYIIIKASNGDVKTVFDACDVCYRSDKGYSQSGTDVRCNNCGNRFPIDGLGNKNTGGTCNPGYLPHTIEGENVVLKIADIEGGAYYFPAEAVTGIEDLIESPSDILLSQNRDQLTVTLPGNGQRTFHIYSVNGQHRASIVDASQVVQIDISSLTKGAYLLAIEKAGTLNSKMFLVY